MTTLIVGMVVAAIAAAVAILAGAAFTALRRGPTPAADRIEERTDEEGDVAYRAPGHGRHHEEAHVHAHSDGLGDF